MAGSAVMCHQEPGAHWPMNAYVCPMFVCTCMPRADFHIPFDLTILFEE